MNAKGVKNMKEIFVSDHDILVYEELLKLKHKSNENIKRMEKTIERIEELKIIHAVEIAENAKK